MRICVKEAVDQELFDKRTQGVARKLAAIEIGLLNGFDIVGIRFSSNGTSSNACGWGIST